MPTNYIYGTVLTNENTAANNRGESLGNTSVLQKVFRHDQVHTSVSAESIRFAIRYRFQLEGLRVNRMYDIATGDLSYLDEKHSSWKTDRRFVDDDLMGFMNATAAKLESEDADALQVNRKHRANKQRDIKGSLLMRHSPLSVGRAVSLRPFRGECSFNCVSGEKKRNISIYVAEMHTTEYQYSFGLNINDVVDKQNTGHLLNAIVDPPNVAGNQSRFFYDFSPATIVLRVTQEHSSRIQNCFEHDERDGTVSISRLIDNVKSGDLDASQLVIGGKIASIEHSQLLALGVMLCAGVKDAINQAKLKIETLDGAGIISGDKS